MSDLSERDFLEEIAAEAAMLQQDIEASKRGLDPSPDARAERRRRVLSDGDFKFFAYTYFPHHIFGEPSLFQQHFCDRFPKLLRTPGKVTEWWQAPRGECKSSLLTKIGPVWCDVQRLLQRGDIRKEVGWEGDAPYDVDYILHLGAETKLPTKLLEIAKTELIHNPSLQMDFPEACGQGKPWKIGEYVSRTGVKHEAFGAEQAVRGTSHGASRPKLLLGDDLITDKEAKSPTERNNRWDWFQKAVKYLGPPDGTVKSLNVGTVLNKDDPISRAKQSMTNVVHEFKAIESMPANNELWEQCEELMRNEDPHAIRKITKRGDVPQDQDLPSYKYYLKHKKIMDEGAKVSWPSVRSLYSLMRERADSPRAFASEMQGDPRTDEDRVFTKYNFWVQRLQHWVMFGGCDPSMGKGETSDPSAILVGGYDLKTLKLHVIEAAIKRRVPSKLSADLIAMQIEYGMQAIGFENNNAYEHMRKTTIKDGLEKSVSLPLVGVTATVAPEVRIDSLEPFITGIEPRILFHSSLRNLLGELDEWPEKQTHHHYDGLTALHILWMIATSRSGGIPKIKTQSAGRRTNLAGYDG